MRNYHDKHTRNAAILSWVFLFGMVVTVLFLTHKALEAIRAFR